MAKKSNAIVPVEVMAPEAKRKGGRPKKEIDEVQLRKLLESMLPVDDIADILGCNPDTIYSRFPEMIRECRGDRKMKLLTSMWRNALDKDVPSMQVWMSKQYLGHKDSQPESAQQVNFNVIVNEVPK